MNTSINIKNLSKAYYLGNDQSSINPRLNNGKFWAISDVSLNINSGEIVGIIGKNGSGKSTLLKIISGITKPTSGIVEIKGTVFSLLEVGAGFISELTGRENIKAYSSITNDGANISDQEIQNILDFSEINPSFYDLPVKYYSAGMYMRLAFSIVANLSSSILVFDEVLAVGDADFKLKCNDIISKMAAEGRTILIATHDPNEVLTLCNKCVYLDQGKVVSTGDPLQIIEQYFSKVFPQKNAPRQHSSTLSNSLYQDETSGIALHHSVEPIDDLALKSEYDLSWMDENAPRCDEVKMIHIKLHAEGKLPNEELYVDDTLYLDFAYEILSDNLEIKPILMIQFQTGAVCLSDGPFLRYEGYTNPYSCKGVYHTTIEIPPFLLNANLYFVGLGFGDNPVTPRGIFHRLLSFTLKHNPKHLGQHAQKLKEYTKILSCPIRPNLVWSTKQSNSISKIK